MLVFRVDFCPPALESFLLCIIQPFQRIVTSPPPHLCVVPCLHCFNSSLSSLIILHLVQHCQILSQIQQCYRGFPTFSWLFTFFSQLLPLLLFLTPSLSSCHLSRSLPPLCRMLLNIFCTFPLLFFTSHSAWSSCCSRLSVSLWSAHRML